MRCFPASPSPLYLNPTPPPLPPPCQMDEFCPAPAPLAGDAAAYSYDVVVVGGGVSGLRAAGHLQSKFGLRVVVLEAQEKYGG